MQNIYSTSGNSQKSYAIRLVTFALILVLIGAIISSLNFTSVSATESYSLIRQWGSRGTGNGQFNFPYSLALDSSNNVYVNDLNNQRIQKFDTNGNFITMWSTGPFNHATGIATDSSNNVYVYHVYNQVIKYTSNGTLIKSWAVNSNPNPNDNDVQPAIAVDSGNNVYASNNNTIFKFTSDGTFIRSWGSEGHGDGQFNQIVGIATDSSDNVYVTDKYAGRVEKFTSDGGFIKTWGGNCQGERVFCSEPQGIATDSSNNVYVTEYNAGRVSKFTSDGNFITGWDAPSAYGIAVDPLGKVYISSGFDNIQVYAPPSTRIHQTTIVLNTIANVPWNTTVTVTGKLTDNNASNAGIGGKTITFTGTGAANLASVTTNPDGTFTDSGISPNTVATGWTVQAQFGGDSSFALSDSSVQRYNTLIHSTSLTLNPIANVPSGTTVTVTGKLTDNVGGAGVAGKTVTFTGTGAGTIASVTTNPDGTFTATGTAPTTVSTGWTVQAHFAGDSLYAPADSIVQTYNTVRTTPIPPDTTITSAVDGNGVTITNGSTTFSSSIRFTFTATEGTNPIAGFECRIDSGAFSPCPSPSTLTNLAAGKHTFQVNAVDTSGNKDPNPATFSWTIATLTPPTKTTITSAVDGNNAPVQNGGTTSSSSIKIAFTAVQGSNPIASFQCSLDNSPFSSCSSPAAFNNLAAGPHKFVVVAVDTAGNKDPNPATFGWTVGTLSPTQSIQQLIQLKHSMHLGPTTDQTLDIRLNIALQFAQNNIKSGTCIQLTVFIKLVQAELRVGHVISFQATQLIQAAQNIQTALGCKVASSGNGIGALSASSLNLTHSQQQQPQTTTSSPSLLQRQSQSPYPYTNQYRYPSQHPYLFQIPRSQLPQNQQPPFNPPTVK